MKKRRRLNIVIAISFLGLFARFSPSFSADAEKKGLKMVIVFPGGPEEEKAVRQFIARFSGVIAEEASLDPREVGGRYFNQARNAIGYLRENPDSFIIGSLGFYLDQRKALKLVPLAKVALAGGPSERYYLMVKKGKYRNLSDLKGGTVSGNTLYEEPAFLSKLVFENKLDATSHFRLQPASRPLSAIRKVARDELDGVLLDEAQYRSLQRLPLSEELEAVYISPRLPEVGLMMVDTDSTRKVKDRLLEALVAVCRSEEGKKAFQSFGVEGFEPIPPGALDDAIRRYESD